jgi:hypothetical protein
MIRSSTLAPFSLSTNGHIHKNNIPSPNNMKIQPDKIRKPELENGANITSKITNIILLSLSNPVSFSVSSNMILIPELSKNIPKTKESIEISII